MTAVNRGAVARTDNRYPLIADYGLIGDCHSVALISRRGSIDWCCMPRLDSESCFGRLLDWAKGGYCTVTPAEDGYTSTRRYLEDTLVLETRFRRKAGEVRLVDAFTMRPGGRDEPYGQLVRIVEGVRGTMDLLVEVVPRFDYGEICPWVRRHGRGFFSAIGGDFGLLLSTDLHLEQRDGQDLSCRFRIRQGQRFRLSLHYEPPHRIHPRKPQSLSMKEIDDRLERTIKWWKQWSSQGDAAGTHAAAMRRSAIVIKALTNAPTGAIAAAATTSLPEAIASGRNWDYRYSWIRDSSFALESLVELGFEKEAIGFRHFIERTTADHAADLQVMYGLGGEHRLTEVTLDFLDGYRGSKPVRLGNAAYQQTQLDIYGELLQVAWRSAQHGFPPDDEFWKLLMQTVNTAAKVWRRPDSGLWEVRGKPRHFVHSKVMCWAAVDRGLRLAERYSLEAPMDEWHAAHQEIRRVVEQQGYDAKRGIFVQAFGGADLDAALLLLPRVDFIAYEDERMVRTADAIRTELSDDHGLVRRYRTPDGLDGDEGVFLTCSFWLVECLARQGRRRDARRIFKRVSSLANELGLFSEEYEPEQGIMLGNFPQGLTHYSHICAALALTDTGHR